MRDQMHKRRVTALGRSKNKTFRWNRSLPGTSESKCLKNLRSFQTFFEKTCSKAMDELQEKLESLGASVNRINDSMEREQDLILAAQTLDKFEEMAEKNGWDTEEFEAKRDKLFSAKKMVRFVDMSRQREELEMQIDRVQKGIVRAEQFIACLDSDVFGSINSAITKDLKSEEKQVKGVRSERPKLIEKLQMLAKNHGGNIAGLNNLFDLVMNKDSRLANTWEALLIVERDAEEKITDFVTEHYALIDDKETDRAHHAFELNQMEKTWRERSLGDDAADTFDEDHYTYLADEERRRELNLLGFEGRNKELEKVHEFITERQTQGKTIDEEYKKDLEQEIQANNEEMESESFVPTLGMRDEYLEYSLLIGPIYRAYVELRRNVMLLLFPGYRKESMTARYSATETQQMREEIQEDLEEARLNWEKAKAEKESAEQQIQTARTVWDKAKEKEQTVHTQIAKAEKALEKATQREREYQEKLASLEEKERDMLAEMKESKETLRQERDELIQREKVLEQEKAQLESRENELSEKQTELEQRNGQLQQQQKKLTASLSELEDNQKALTAKKKVLEKEKRTLAEANQALEVNSTKVQAECDALTAKLAERESELEAKQTTLNAKEQELAVKEGELALAQQELANVRSKLGGESQELQNRRASLAEHKEEHQAEAAALEAAKDHFAKLSADLTTQREALDKDKAEFNQERQAFVKDRSQYKEEVEQQSQQLDQRMADLTAKSKELDGKAKDLVEREDLTNQVADLEDKLEILIKKNQQLQSKVEVTSQEASNRRLSSLGHQKQKATLESQVVDLEAKQQAGAEASAQQIKDLNANLNKLTKEKDVLINLRDRLKETVRQQTADLEALRNDQKTASESAEAELAKARGDIDSQVEQNKALQTEIESLRGEVQSRQFHKVPGRIMWVAGSASTFAFTAATLAVLATLDTTLPAATLFANPAMSVLFALAAVSVIVAVVGGALEVTHQCKKTSLLKAQSDSNLHTSGDERDLDVTNDS